MEGGRGQTLMPPGRVVVMPSGKFDGDRFDVEEVRVEAVAVERK